jgi:enoyl-CoA hydratase/carnithine racemase
MTGQEISAKEAKELGLVAEVMPRADLLPRAYELARVLNARPPFAVRWSRSTILHHTKQEIYAQLGDKHQAFGLTRDLMAGDLPFKATPPGSWTVDSAVGAE